LRSASRAGSPLLFGLAPRGVCLAAAITGGAVGSYPTFSPLPACVPFVDIPEVFLQAITGFRSAGGPFSVALSVTRFSRAASPGVTRRVALHPHALRPKGLLRSPRSGVRTFLPLHVALAFSPASSVQPAIIQLTRHVYYTAQSSMNVRKANDLLVQQTPEQPPQSFWQFSPGFFLDLPAFSISGAINLRPAKDESRIGGPYLAAARFTPPALPKTRARFPCGGQRHHASGALPQLKCKQLYLERSRLPDPEQLLKLLLIQNRHAQSLGLVVLRSRVRSDHQVIRLLAHRPAHLSAMLLHQRARLFA